MSKTVISCSNITKHYRDNGIVVKAVRGIDMEVAEGEFTAIVGPSGSGKTTFLNVISGLDTPTSGEVVLNGRKISEMSGKELSDFRRDNIGFIFQAYNLMPVLTVAENVEYVMLLQGIPKQERRGKVMELLGELGIEEYADRFPPQLSGGQQQRVAIARAMVSRPTLVMADEPTANLDAETSGDLLDMMRELNERTGMTFLFSTHDELVMERARRLIVLKSGKIHSDKKKS